MNARRLAEIRARLKKAAPDERTAVLELANEIMSANGLAAQKFGLLPLCERIIREHRNEVADAADLLERVEKLTAALREAKTIDADCRNFGTPAPAIGCERDCHPCDVMRAVCAALEEP